MKKLNDDEISLEITHDELKAIKNCLEMIFEKYSDIEKERERIAVLDLVFKHAYPSQLAIYIYEQIYDKIVKIKRSSIFDKKFPVLKLTQTEIELLYIVAQSMFDVDGLVQELKNKALWTYYDNNLANLLALPKEEKTYQLSSKSNL